MRLWYNQTFEEVLASLGAAKEGLTAREVETRLRRFGYNELRGYKEPLWKKLIEPFRSVFIIILLFAAGISFISRESLDGAIILLIVAVNTAIFYSQRHATERVLKSLKKQSEQLAAVWRDGRKLDIPSRLVVPGDILILSEGARVPADARLLQKDYLFADESALTGESLPIEKMVSTIVEERPIYDQDNMLFQGTYIVSGSGRAIVVETGMRTEFGRIAELAVRAEPQSPMQLKIDFIVGRLIKVLAAVAIIVFVLALVRGIAPAEALRFVLALSVSAVPEDLPIALSVILVLGMRRMAKKNALVRSMKTMEDIGIVTVVAVDKTGTLTQNNLKVTEAWALNPAVDLKAAAYKSLGELSSSTEPFDKALHVLTAGSRQSGRLLKNYPFQQAQRMSGALWNESGKPTFYVKGAPEHLLNLCRLSGPDTAAAQSQLYTLVSKGYRVIALARTEMRGKEAPADLKDIAHLKFEFVGLLAFADELRPESKTAVSEAHQAGVDIKMITGDHFETAFRIGQALGICEYKGQVIAGSELPDNEEELGHVVKEKTVFARILPEQKFKILKALKKYHITAMTGDGVNDVPALANADIGIAMGAGSDIAKDAGDILLTDNNFSSIIKAIAEGRVIYDNIRRMMFYLLSSSLGEVLTMIGALLVGLPLPVTAVQILWINLVTDTAFVIPLGLEPPEEDHMKRPPRPPKAPVLDRLILSRVVLVGVAMATSTLAVFGYLVHQGYSHQYAQTVAFMTLVAAQWINAFNARSETQYLLRRSKVPNTKLLAGLLIAITLQALVMFGPLSEAFTIASVDTAHLLIGAGISMLAVYLAAELHKLYNRSRVRI